MPIKCRRNGALVVPPIKRNAEDMKNICILYMNRNYLISRLGMANGTICILCVCLVQSLRDTDER